jgi:UDP-N-acetylmuramate dehydrogenase
MTNILTTLKERLGDKVGENKDISYYITLRTQVKAEYFFEAESRDDLINAYKTAKELQIPFMVLGGGSNMAILVDILPGLIVRNMYQKFEVVEDTTEYGVVKVSSGYLISRLIKETTDRGMEGFEYQMGLPGSLGGGLYMNSKWTRPLSYMGDTLTKAYILDKDGNEKVVDRDYFHFAYDYSILQETKELLLEAEFKLKKNDPALLKQRAQEAQQYRKETQPFGVATSGCFFQNISQEDKSRLQLPTTSAGYLIDHAGMKNYQVGAFKVSDKHANFIINTGAGDPHDLIRIIQDIKNKVKDAYGVELEEEVRLINK